jgi:anti-sigma regulatory factor (Ser/Thr protein kinase)
MRDPTGFSLLNRAFRLHKDAFESNPRGENLRACLSCPLRDEDDVKETLTLRLTGGATAPSRARSALSSLDLSLADLRDDVHLLVSELVSNSVLHADADHVELRATAEPKGVRIEVSDPGPGFDEQARREPSLNGEGGYGLLIVDKVANRWGVKRNDWAGVWFEIDRDSRRNARERVQTASA